jgi:hypothetical protein
MNEERTLQCPCKYVNVSLYDECQYTMALSDYFSSVSKYHNAKMSWLYWLRYFWFTKRTYEMLCRFSLSLMLLISLCISPQLQQVGKSACCNPAYCVIRYMCVRVFDPFFYDFYFNTAEFLFILFLLQNGVLFDHIGPTCCNCGLIQREISNIREMQYFLQPFLWDSYCSIFSHLCSAL